MRADLRRHPVGIDLYHWSLPESQKPSAAFGQGVSDTPLTQSLGPHSFIPQFAATRVAGVFVFEVLDVHRRRVIGAETTSTARALAGFHEGTLPFNRSQSICAKPSAPGRSR